MDAPAISTLKIYVANNGGLQDGESLADALKRLPDYSEAFEQSRMQSVFQAGRECHVCSCHLYPPCQQCVDCEVCNKEYEL
jgi:hypothetical protein